MTGWAASQQGWTYDPYAIVRVKILADRSSAAMLREVRGYVRDWTDDLRALQLSGQLSAADADWLRGLVLDGYDRFVSSASAATVEGVANALETAGERARAGLAATLGVDRVDVDALVAGLWEARGGEDMARAAIRSLVTGDPGAVDDSVRAFLRGARANNVTALQTRTDLMRLIRGDDIDYGKYGIERPDATPLRNAEYRARRLLISETMNANRDAMVEAMAQTGMIRAASWNRSEGADDCEACDELAEGGPYALEEWPEAPHPHCMCMPGEPFELQEEAIGADVEPATLDSEDIANRFLKRFGETDNPADAGFLTPKGQLIDYSAKTLKLSPYRVEHWRMAEEVLGVTPSEYMQTDALKQVLDAGMARMIVDYENSQLYLEVTQPLTAKQLQAARAIVGKGRWTITVDVRLGDRIVSRTFDGTMAFRQGLPALYEEAGLSAVGHDVGADLAEARDQFIAIGANPSATARTADDLVETVADRIPGQLPYTIEHDEPTPPYTGTFRWNDRTLRLTSKYWQGLDDYLAGVRNDQTVQRSVHTMIHESMHGASPAMQVGWPTYSQNDLYAFYEEGLTELRTRSLLAPFFPQIDAALVEERAGTYIREVSALRAMEEWQPGITDLLWQSNSADRVTLGRAALQYAIEDTGKALGLDADGIWHAAEVWTGLSRDRWLDKFLVNNGPQWLLDLQGYLDQWAKTPGQRAWLARQFMDQLANVTIHMDLLPPLPGNWETL